jgi:hypothetical protein
MAPACDKCGTTDFTFRGRPLFALICPNCRLVMCWACAGRSEVDAIPLLCCYHCRSTGLREASVWADRLKNHKGLESAKPDPQSLFKKPAV